VNFSDADQLEDVGFTFSNVRVELGGIATQLTTTQRHVAILGRAAR